MITYEWYMEKSHCHCCLLVTSGGESPYQFLFKLGRILFTTTCFHCCWVISMWAAESQAVLTFSMQFLIKNCAWRRCDILSFTVKFTEGDWNDSSRSYYWVHLSMHVLLMLYWKLYWKSIWKRKPRLGLFTQSSYMGIRFSFKHTPCINTYKCC